MGWSLIQRSSTDCGVSKWMWLGKPQECGDTGPGSVVVSQKKETLLYVGCKREYWIITGTTIWIKINFFYVFMWLKFEELECNLYTLIVEAWNIESRRSFLRTLNCFHTSDRICILPCFIIYLQNLMYEEKCPVSQGISHGKWCVNSVLQHKYMAFAYCYQHSTDFLSDTSNSS